MSYIEEMKNEQCNNAIIKVFKYIDIEKIEKFIEDIECITNVRKEFYKNIIKYRYKIIRDTYEKIK